MEKIGMVDGLIEINNKEYYKLYKDIIKTCLKDGVLLPSLLDIVDVPDKYNYSFAELEKLKINKRASSKRQDLQMEREIQYNNADDSDEYDLLLNQELMDFIANYPEFQKILKI